MMEEAASGWFIKYGGPSFWEDFGRRFYEKVMTHQGLKKYFAGKPEGRIKEIASDMWQIVLGFTGPMCASAIEKKHTALGVSDFDYAQYVSLMRQTLFEVGVETEDINEIEERLSDLKSLVCGH